MDRFIDGHIHLDHILRARPQCAQWFREVSCIAISWAFAAGAKDVTGHRAYLRAHAETIAELRRGGLECFYLNGIHPRTIVPDLAPGHVREMILPFLDDPLCLGVGEIGLEKGDDREVEILEAHLALRTEVLERGKIFGIHTPRQNKASITQATLRILEKHAEINQHSVIDHTTPETISEVLERGFWAGMTLSPIKSTSRDVKFVWERFEPARNRIVLNTDSGGGVHEELFAFFHSKTLSPDARRQLAFENASRCFRIR